MATENINIEVLIETANSAKNLGDLKKSMADVRKALDGVEIGSKSFGKLNGALEEGSQRLRTFRRGFDGMQAFEAFGKTIASSFGIASGVISQFAGDNEDLQKSLNKVAGALTIVQSFSQLEGAIKAAKEANLALNASLLTNPYVLVAAGIAAAIAALISFGDETENVKNKTEEANQALLVLNDYLNNIATINIGNLEKQKALTDDVVEQGRIEVKIIEEKLRAANDYQKGIDKQIKTAVEEAQRQGKSLKQYQEDNKELFKLQEAGLKNITTLQTQLDIRKIENQKEINNLSAKQFDAANLQNIQAYIDAYQQLVDAQQFQYDILVKNGADQETLNAQLIQNLNAQEQELTRILDIISKTDTRTKEGLEKKIQLQKEYNALLLKTDQQIVLTGINTGQALQSISSGFVVVKREAELISTQLSGIFESAKKVTEVLSTSLPIKSPTLNLLSQLGSQYLSVVSTFGAFGELQRQLLNTYTIIEKGRDVNEKAGDDIAAPLNFYELTLKQQRESIERNFKELFENLDDDVKLFLKTSEESLGMIGQNVFGPSQINEDFLKSINFNTKAFTTNYETLVKFVQGKYSELSKLNKDQYDSGFITFKQFSTNQETIYQQTMGNLDTLGADFSSFLTDNSEAVSKATGLTTEEINKLADVVETTIPAAAKKSVEQTNAEFKEFRLSEVMMQELKDAEKGLQLLNDVSGRINNIFSNIAANRLTAVENAASESQRILQEQLDAGLLSEEQYNNKKEQLDKESAERIRQEKKKAWRQQKAADVVTATIGVANAVINGLQTQPFLPLGLASAALAGVLGAVQIGTIISQPEPAFAQGGYVVGPGGPTDDAISAKLSNGEFVINKKSTDAYRPLLEAINQFQFMGLGNSTVTKTNSNVVQKAVPQQQDFKVNLKWGDVENFDTKAKNIKSRVTF